MCILGITFKMFNVNMIRLGTDSFLGVKYFSFYLYYYNNKEVLHFQKLQKVIIRTNTKHQYYIFLTLILRNGFFGLP